MPKPADIDNLSVSFAAPSKEVLAKDDAIEEAGSDKIPENDIIKAIDAAQEISTKAIDDSQEISIKDKSPKSVETRAKKFPDVTSAIAHISTCLEAGTSCSPDQCNKPTDEKFKEVIEIEIEVSAKDEDLKFMRRVAKEASAYLKKAKHTPEKIIANKQASSSPSKLAKLKQRLGNSSNKIGFNVDKNEKGEKNEKIEKNDAVNKPSTLADAFAASADVKDKSPTLKDTATMDTIEIIDSPEKPTQVIDVDQKAFDPPVVSKESKPQEDSKESDFKDLKDVPTNDEAKKDGGSRKRKLEDEVEEPEAKVVKITENNCDPSKNSVSGDNSSEYIGKTKKIGVMFGIWCQEYTL